jgi:4a-hydroxytetrahydrobiopterin dehydratase
MAAKLAADEVARRAAVLPGWSADADRAIRKTFQFADHIAAMGFVTKVAICAEVLDHHPDLRIVYRTVDVALNTHDAGGVTEKDFALAQKIEQYAT